MIVIAPSAGAVNLINTCKNSGTPGAEMGHYPAWPGSQSYLRMSCIFNHSTAGSGDFVSSTFTIHDFSNVRYHNGAGRTFTVSVGGAATTFQFTVADCTAATGWVNRGITGSGIPARAFVTSISAGCVVTLNKAIVAPGVAVNDVVLIENSNVRAVTDATLQVGSPMVCSATLNVAAGDATGDDVSATNITPGTTMVIPPALPCPLGTTGFDLSAAPTPGLLQLVTVGGTKDGAGPPTTTGVSTTRTVNDGAVALGATNTLTSNAARFFNSDIGLRVFGGGSTPVTQPCYILSRTNTVATVTPLGCAPVNNGGVACTSAPNPENRINCTYTIGEPSRTSPTSTDTMLNQGVQLPLNPTLVPGSQPCTADNSSGFGIEGTWVSPGSFVANSAFATQPGGGSAGGGTRAVGEILFKTAVISYAAFIIEVPAAPIGTDPLIGGYHFNLVFPNVPTGLALCPSTPTSPGLGFSIGVNGAVVSQASIPTGVGRPATAQLRSTVASTTGSTSTVFITDDFGQPNNGPPVSTGAGLKWMAGVDPNFNRLCSIPAGPPVINFTCGNG